MSYISTDVPGLSLSGPARTMRWMLRRLLSWIRGTDIDREAMHGVGPTGPYVPKQEEWKQVEAEFAEALQAAASTGDLADLTASLDLQFLGWAVWASPIYGTEPVRVLAEPGGDRYWFETEGGHRYGLASGYDLEEDLPTLYMAGKLSLNPDLLRSVAGPDRSAAVILGDDGRPRFSR